MKSDNILEIGIDSLGRLYIKPEKEKFHGIWREGAEVHWDVENHFLYSPKPREWSYFDWYKHIIKIANCNLVLTSTTKWVNIPDDLKKQINEYRTHQE